MHFDIFCRVIDNYGDIGVCWRLARHLADRSPQHRITLWVDDLERFQRIEPLVKPQEVQALTAAITVVRWTPHSTAREPGEIVIEAFNCDPPVPFIRAMVARKSLWINLEYLSAEAWVEGCHGLPSLQSNGLKKFFFFPGFTAGTGGLLREDGLLEQRDRWLQQPGQRWALLQRLGVSAGAIEALQNGARQALLFGYPGAPVNALAHVLAESHTRWVLLVPDGLYADLRSPDTQRLHIIRIPFVAQNDFDRLLWSSDLNFVRGEDSVVRALWAGKPLVWQIYEQEDSAHLAKLQAWLALSPYPQDVQRLMLNWNTKNEALTQNKLGGLIDGPDWAQWQATATQWANQLANQPALACNLDAFCAKNQ